MFESKINRGRANGYAPLDGSGKVPLDKLPPIQSTINTGSLATTGSNTFTDNQIISGSGDTSLTIGDINSPAGPSFGLRVSGSDGAPLFLTSDGTLLIGAITNPTNVSDDASFFANQLDSYPVSDGPTAAILVQKSGSFQSNWVFDYDGKSYFPSDITIGYNSLGGGLTSGSLNITNGDINLTGSLFVSGNVYANNLTGSTIDTTSLATTGSNVFIGNQSISGSVNISSSLVVSSTIVSNGNIEALNSDLIIDGGDLIISGGSYFSGSLNLSNGLTIDSTKYGPTGDITIGGDSTYIRIDDGGAPPALIIATDGGENEWYFGYDGTLTLPDSSPILFGGNNCQIQAGQGFRISSDGGILIDVTGSQWVFGPDGSLTTPGDIILSGSLLISGSINGASNLVTTSSFNSYTASVGSINTSSFVTRTSVPTSLTGSEGDIDGMIAFDSGAIYFANETYYGAGPYTTTLYQSTASSPNFPITKGNFPKPKIGWTINVADGFIVETITNVVEYTDYWLVYTNGGNSTVMAPSNVTLTTNGLLDNVWLKQEFISSSILNSLNTFTGSIQSEVSAILQTTASLNSKTGSYATTGSNQFNGNQNITGSLNHGLGNTATGENSHAEGDSTQAIGLFSHAEGLGTIAYGGRSHAEGRDTLASGSYSHAEGYQTIALGDNQHVQGQYNFVSPVQSAFIVGNGIDDVNRSNLIHAAGNTVEITGSLNVSGSIYKDGNKQFNYGQWASLETQTGSANTAYAMKLEVPTPPLSGMYVGNNGSGFPTRIYVENTGLYNVQFSAQLHTTANESVDFSVWFAMTGSNIANSNTDFSIEKVSGGGFQVAALNFLTPITSGSYVELYWSKTTANGQLQYKGTQSTPTRPATPSVIVTVTQVA